MKNPPICPACKKPLKSVIWIPFAREGAWNGKAWKDRYGVALSICICPRCHADVTEIAIDRLEFSEASRGMIIP